MQGVARAGAALTIVAAIIGGTATPGMAQSATTATTTAKATQPVESKERIVSLNGGNTEVLFALGLGDQIVGRDLSSSYPPEANELPSVGYQFQLNAEGILSLKPTIVIGRADVKPSTVIDQLRAAGVRVELLDEPTTFDGAKDRIMTLGTLLDREPQAMKLVEGLEADIQKYAERRAELGDKAKKKGLFIYMRGPKMINILGVDTAPGAMLETIGVDYALKNARSMVPVTAESIIAASPEVIVLFTHGLESVGGVEGFLKVPGIAQTPAGKNRRIVAVDDSYLGNFTHRVGKAALDVLNALQAEGVVTVQGR